jgi:anti-sigma factor RsiW
MSEPLRIPDEQLHALIDGELPAQEGAELETAVAADPYLSRRVELFRADKARLAEIYGPVASMPVPDGWIRAIQNGPARQQPRFFSIEAIAGIAAAVMVVIGGTLVYRESLPHEEPIVQEALAARSDSLSPRQVLAVNAPAEDAAATRTLSSALAMHVSVPDLKRMGYSLVGMRVYGSAPKTKGVELLYRHRDNRIFALYLRRPSGPPRFDQYKQGNLRVCIWQDDVLGAVMTGEMSAAEMQRLASLAYTGLES